MPGDGDLGHGRGKFYGALFGGPQQSPGNLPAPPTAEPEGDVVRGAQADLAYLKPDLQRKLPEGMAELLVYPRQSAADGSPRFRLRVMCCCTQVEDLDVEYGQPDLDLGSNLAPGGPPPARFLETMRSWSYEKGELTRWLDHRRCKHPDKLELVIWDSTKFRIPWELFWVPAKRESGRSAGYLGALLTVTRWVTMNPYWLENVKPFTNPAPYRASGPVAAYIAPDMEQDREFLHDFAVQDTASMEELFEFLAGDPAALAMVYVACHGEFGDDPEDCVLGGFPLGSVGRFSDDLPRLSSQSTLVFLNGCRTGAIGVDTGKYNDGALRGFAEVFLRCGAAGVLATTGAVGKKEAGTLAKALIDYLSENRDLSVADAVRLLRARAAEDMPELLRTNMSQEERRAADGRLLPLLYPFMYVYFGSPRMVMSLAAGGGLAGASELAETGG